MLLKFISSISSSSLKITTSSSFGGGVYWSKSSWKLYQFTQTFIPFNPFGLFNDNHVFSPSSALNRYLQQQLLKHLVFLSLLAKILSHLCWSVIKHHQPWFLSPNSLLHIKFVCWFFCQRVTWSQGKFVFQTFYTNDFINMEFWKSVHDFNSSNLITQNISIVLMMQTVCLFFHLTYPRHCLCAPPATLVNPFWLRAWHIRSLHLPAKAIILWWLKSVIINKPIIR